MITYFSLCSPLYVPLYNFCQYLIQISYLGLCSPIDVAISRHVTGINAPPPSHKLAQPEKIFAKYLGNPDFFTLLGIIFMVQKCPVEVATISLGRL